MKINHDSIIRSFLLALVFTLGLTSCFEQSTSSTDSGSSGTKGLITSADFTGATDAHNTITGVEVAWEASKLTPASYRVYRVNGSRMTLLTTLASSVTSFIDGSVTWGTIYSYVVRAVDTNGVEDDNVNRVSALAWGSITSAVAAGRNSITVNFGSPVAVADEVRIYLQPISGGDKILADTVSGSDTTVTINGLRTGFGYYVSAQAYVAALKKEDGNTATISVYTNTVGYHDEGPSTSKWLNVMNVRAFGASPGAPVHPAYPERTPTTELVELAFRAFNGMAASTQYVVTRAAENSTLDTSVETLCDPSMTASCRVKCWNSGPIMTGTGVLNCRDEQAGPAPARYRYTMSVVQTDGTLTWVEPVPQDELDSFSILVPVPPVNMVLVQRDAVNYEMCQEMNTTVDPLHHNRCPYTGVGATPYNSGPDKPPLTFDSGYYDFGYNLFVDRFEYGCKWTRASDGGMCGAGASPGDCVGYTTGGTAPSNTIGKDGDIFLMLFSYNSASYHNEQGCYYKYNNTWYRSNAILNTLPSAKTILGSMYTGDPSSNAGKIGITYENMTAYQVWNTCQAQVDPNYGSKRMPRMREFRAYSTFATQSGDQYGMTFSQAWTLANGNAFNSSSGYRCPVNYTTSTYSTYPTSIADMLSGSNDLMAINVSGSYYGGTFEIGATSNVDCQGRYGMQAPMDLTTWQWVSDNLNFNSDTKTVTGTVSMFDNGNRDLLQDINGGQTGFTIDYTNANPNGTSSPYFYFPPGGTNVINYVAVPLGLPILSTSSSVYISRNSVTDHYYPSMYFPYVTTPNYTPRGVRVSKRFQTAVDATATSGQVLGFRCVMSAE